MGSFSASIKCPVCGMSADYNEWYHSDSFHVDCDCCGRYFRKMIYYEDCLSENDESLDPDGYSRSEGGGYGYGLYYNEKTRYYCRVMRKEDTVFERESATYGKLLFETFIEDGTLRVVLYDGYDIKDAFRHYDVVKSDKDDNFYLLEKYSHKYGLVKFYPERAMRLSEPFDKILRCRWFQSVKRDFENGKIEKRYYNILLKTLVGSRDYLFKVTHTDDIHTACYRYLDYLASGNAIELVPPFFPGREYDFPLTKEEIEMTEIFDDIDDEEEKLSTENSEVSVASMEFVTARVVPSSGIKDDVITDEELQARLDDENYFHIRLIIERVD